MSSSGTDSQDAEAANKKAKIQHSEAHADSIAQIASSSPGPGETTVVLYARTSTPTTSCSVYTVDTTTTTTSFNPLMTPTTMSSARSDQGMSHFTSEENKHLSEIMNGTERSLAVARIQQQNVERLNTIIELLCGLLKRPYMAFVGSIAEGTDDGKSDKDTVWFSDYYDGFDSLTILPDERHPGYSKIQVDLSENSELKNYTVEIDDKGYLKNSVKKLIIKDRALHNFPSELSSHGAAYTAEVHYIHGESILINRDSEEVDHVLCIKRPDWPDEAAEWKTRNMHSNWPTDKLVTKITKSGYLLTAVGSKESIESEIQWRVSFNEAELLLIKSFNETQLHCIRLLKLLKKDLSKIAAKNITSYTMKNIMFWCLEKKSNDYWQPSNLMCCFCFCLSELLSCVENEFLSNYFIRKRNLFISRGIYL